jgi:hypothetical protein
MNHGSGTANPDCVIWCNNNPRSSANILKNLNAVGFQIAELFYRFGRFAYLSLPLFIVFDQKSTRSSRTIQGVLRRSKVAVC